MVNKHSQFVLLFLIIISFPTLARADSPTCPTPPSFSATTPVPAPNFTYPFIIPSGSSGWLMFSGGLTSQLPESIRSSISSDHFRFPLSQEEIWVSHSADLVSFSSANPSFKILPETPVAFESNSPYSTVYPSGFKTGCIGLTPDTQCNVQINDPSAVIFNNNIYLYFTILENYRWYDGTQGLIVNGNPNTPDKQNIHSIGLAVSNDNGQNWAFVDKVILENETDTSGDPILGAWAPSAIVSSLHNVDIYFHDALGTKQYVAHLTDGASLSNIERLNRHDETYRTNLDVIKNGSLYEMVYNDSSFNISRTYFNNSSDFGTLCAPTVIVPADSDHLWPTPHQIVKDNQVHLFFWQFQDPSQIMHWSRENNSNIPKSGDLNSDGNVNLFDYNLLVAGYGTTYSIFDYNNLVANYGK